MAISWKNPFVSKPATPVAELKKETMLAVSTSKKPEVSIISGGRRMGKATTQQGIEACAQAILEGGERRAMAIAVETAQASPYSTSDVMSLARDLANTMRISRHVAAGASSTAATAAALGLGPSGGSLHTAMSTSSLPLPSPAAVAAGEDTSDASGWKRTSMRWIEENHPEYVVRTPTAHAQLKAALSRMSMYNFPHLPATDRAPFERDSIRVALGSWGPESHDKMVQFLRDGGFKTREAEHMRLEQEKLDTKALNEQRRQRAKEAAKARAQAPREQTLDEAVAAELGYAGGFGSW